MEVILGTVDQKRMKHFGRGSVKVSTKVELKAAAKKVLSTTASVHGLAVERAEEEFRISGKVTTRVIYIDEFDAFNSEDRTDNFADKIVVRGMEVFGNPSVNATILETVAQDFADMVTLIDVESVVELNLMGLVASEVRFASGVQGDAEVKMQKTKISTFGSMMEEKFSTDERVELDKNCTGVLGVDFRATVRDIDCNDGRVTVKGVVSANVIGVKTTETSVIYNSVHEFDFVKNINMADLSMDDAAIGNIAIGGTKISAENKGKPELVLEVDLVFSGAVVKTREIEFAVDAISFDNYISLTPAEMENMICGPQTNVVADIEGNVIMSNNSFISRILCVNGAGINGVNIVPADGKVTIEGVLAATVVYECEDKQTHTHRMQVPFSTTVRTEMSGDNMQVTATVMGCHVKARRGKELLVDAKLGLCIAVTRTEITQVTGNILLGEPKQRDDSAIMIYIVDEVETLWDVAKRINISSNEIIKQNPFVGDGVKPGDKLFIYRQNVVSF